MTHGFSRTTRKLSLTEEGRLYYERCFGPLRDLENAQSAITEKGRSPSGTLRVTALSPFGRTYLLPLIPAFSRRYPAIELELHLDDAVSDMIAGGYDGARWLRSAEIYDPASGAFAPTGELNWPSPQTAT